MQCIKTLNVFLPVETKVIWNLLYSMTEKWLTPYVGIPVMRTRFPQRHVSLLNPLHSEIFLFFSEIFSPDKFHNKLHIKCENYMITTTQAVNQQLS